jgi:fluoride ion exporter CrcB/FEX
LKLIGLNLTRFWVEGSLIVISDWVIEVVDCGKFLFNFVGSLLVGHPVGLLWPNGKPKPVMCLISVGFLRGCL